MKLTNKTIKDLCSPKYDTQGEEEEGMTAAASDRSYYSSRSRRHLRQRGRRFPTYDVRHRTREEARPPPVVQESLLVR